MTDEIREKQPGSKVKIILASVVVLIVAAVAIYFGYWRKTPQYSLQIIQTAMAKHDMATFEKHVDVNNVASKAIDDMVAATVTPEDVQNPLMQSMLVMVKNAALPAFMSQIRTYVETGNFRPVLEKDDGQEIAAATAQRTGLTALQFKKIAETVTKGDTALISCQMYDKQLKQDFIITLQMGKLSDGTWKIQEIANLQDFLTKHDKAVAAKLVALNEPIAAKIAEKVVLLTDGSKTYKVERLTDNKPLQGTSVRAEFSFKILDSQVKRVQGNVEIYDEHKDVLFSRPFDSENKDLTTQQVWSFANTWQLNKFDGLDRNVIKADMSKTTYGVIFTGIELKDGTVIKFLTDLPLEKSQATEKNK